MCEQFTTIRFYKPSFHAAYTIGAAGELYLDQWTVRLMHLLSPVEPNSQTIKFQPFKSYSDQMEFEHDHTLFSSQSGAVRLLLYRNHELMGRFTDAINAFKPDPVNDNASNCGNLYRYGSNNATAPEPFLTVTAPSQLWCIGFGMVSHR